MNFKSREDLSPSNVPSDYNSKYQMNTHKFVIIFYCLVIVLYYNVINRWGEKRQIIHDGVPVPKNWILGFKTKFCS